MMRHHNVWGIWAALVLLAGGVTLAQDAPAEKPAGALASSPAKQLPTLAVIGSVEEAARQNLRAGGQERENMEDLLAMELGQQPFLKLVDRQALETVMKEHAIALASLNDAKNAIALGKFAGADYLLCVLIMRDETVASRDKASVRLVEVATGQVKVEEEVKLSADLALFCAAIREKVLATLRPESQAVNRLTVGIAEFPNRSGTARSETLGVALQKALRKRLKDEAWAVVLERQYPTALLSEVDLARSGLVRDKVVETLPPADLVILGSMEDADREYEPGKKWTVKLDLTLRLRDQSSQIDERCRSDAIESAADRIMAKIEEFRRQPTSHAAVSEKELWRRQAFYLMPPRCETWAKAIVPNFYSCSEVTKLETIRAWENVLVLDANDAEAMTYLGVCMVGFNRSNDEATVAKCIAGSRLVERVARSYPSDVRADTFISCIAFVRGLSTVHATDRAREMAQYITDHPKEFKHADSYWVKSTLTAPPQAAGNVNAVSADWTRVIQNSGKDPDSVILAFSQARGGKEFPIEKAAGFLGEYLDSPDPVVRFVAHRALGESLCRKKDVAGLEHFDKAIEALEDAYPRCTRGYGSLLSNVYRLRIEACQRFGRPEEAKETALAGAARCRKLGRYDDSVAWLYQYCVTEVLGAGQEKESLAICDAYFAGVKKEYWVGRNPQPIIAAKREELLARLAGKPVPDTGGLHVVKGTEGTNLPMLRMAATQGKLWLVSGASPSFGNVLLYQEATDGVSRLPDVPYPVSSVAATSDAVYFGGQGGLYKCDTNGKLLRHYDQEHAAMPGGQVYEVCEGGGKIYFVFQSSPYQGVAALDPTSDKISVMAPSSHEASQKTEPLVCVFRLRWDAATPRLYAFCYQYWYFNSPMLTNEYHWSPHDKTWQPYPIKEAPHVVVSEGDETLVVRVSGDQSEFHFLKTGQKVLAAVPVPQLMGEPAWDDSRLWVPTASGLYEVDRATGDVRWLAYQDGNPFISLLKADTRLYVATSRGLYYREIPPTHVDKVAPVSAPGVPGNP